MPRKAVELDRSRTPLILAGIIVIGLAATGGAIIWGASDAGQINVSATITNSQLTDGNDAVAVQPATKELSDLPNGGLMPQGSDGASVPAPEPIVETGATSSATGTPAEVATSSAAL